MGASGRRRVKERLFRFKQFSVRHSDSSMPIGVDGVLVGAWAKAEGCRDILDIGTGCGVIALILAQRNLQSAITAIDIDRPSVDEATCNFNSSPWHSSLTAVHSSLEDFTYNKKNVGRFDCIVSNPPYFDSGISDPSSARLRARHEASLPLDTLARHSSLLLKEGGKLTVILPADEISGRFQEYCRIAGLSLTRLTQVKGHPGARVKRHLLEFEKKPEGDVSESTLVLESSPGVPTADYRSLCADLYLRF